MRRSIATNSQDRRNGQNSRIHLSLPDRAPALSSYLPHPLYGNEAEEVPPVVLLHGFPETNFAWQFQIPVLAERYRVIAPDLRGYGETEKPATGYDKRNMALDLAFGRFRKSISFGRFDSRHEGEEAQDRGNYEDPKRNFHDS
jgi:hypothetical protein